MKRLLVEDGIRTSLASIFSGAQDVYEGNFTELISTMYTYGFFIKKIEESGTYDTDFQPTIINSNPPKIQINIGTQLADDPISRANMGGKIVTLNTAYILEPFKTDHYITTTPTGSNIVLDSVTGPLSGTGPIDYYIWAVPGNIDTQVVDYLPNYKVDGQTKKLVRNYYIDFVLTKVSSTIGNPVDGLKICKVTINNSTTSITNLVDLRFDYRAYLKPELYDFFTSSFLKQKYTIVNVGKSTTEPNLTLSNTHKLNGKIELVGSKIHNCRILVSFTNFDLSTVPETVEDGIVIFITVNPNEFFIETVLTKIPEKSFISTFEPSDNKIVIGIYKSVSILNEGGGIS